MNFIDRIFYLQQRLLTLAPLSGRQCYIEQNKYKKLIFMRRLSENLFVFLLQYMGLMMSLSSSYFSPAWFASGTACGFIFLRGYRVLPGIWLGTFLAYYLAELTVAVALMNASLFALQAFAILGLSERYISPSLVFYRYFPFFKFILCTLLITGGVSFILASSMTAGVQFWLANFDGILIVAFALITLDTYFPEIDQLKQKNKFFLILIYGLLLIGIGGFLFSYSLYWLIGTAFYVLMISACFGWCATVVAIFLHGMLWSLAVYVNTDAFTGYFTIDQYLFLQLIFTFEIIIGLTIAIGHQKKQ